MYHQAMMKQLQFTTGVVHSNVEGVTDAESRVAPPGGGSSMNWVVGHILYARNLIFDALGAEGGPAAEALTHYERGGSPSNDGALPLDELVAQLDASQDRLLQAIEAAPDEHLQAPSNAPEGSPVAGLSVGDAVAALVFHEAYHVGQLGTLRRLTGKPGAIA